MMRALRQLGCAATMPLVAATAVTIQAPRAPIDALNERLASQLSPDQSAAIAAVHPDFRLIAICRGRFSGAADELVAGLLTPPSSVSPRALHRVGLLREESRWAVHRIDEELERDASVTHSYPFSWDIRIDAKGVDPRMTCGVEPGHHPDLDGGGRRLFDRRRARLQRSTPVCFATSDVYNNWDCVLYSPTDRRFRLWYQQARAD